MVDQNNNFEYLGNNVRRHRMHNKGIVVFQVRSVSRSAVDTWAEAVIEELQTWPQDQPYLALHDFSGLGLTPYSRRRAEEVTRKTPDYLSGRYAVVVSRGLIGNTIRFFGKLNLTQIAPGFESEYFTDYEAALHWLEEYL